MEEIKIKGIVIKATDYKDSDKIVTIFSAEKGLIRARIRGVKKKGAKLVFAVQPFAFVEFLLNAKDGFYTIINATSIDQFYDITNNFDDYIFMLSCLEVVEKTVKENENQVDLFLLLLNSLKLVCYERVASINVFIKFMFEAMRFLGFSFNFDHCAKCGGSLDNSDVGFSYDYNGLICSKCLKKEQYLELTRGELAVIKNINQTAIEKLGNLKFNSRDDLVSVVSLVVKVFRINTDFEINSIKMFI